MKLFVRTLLSVSVVHWLTSIGVVLTTASAAVFLVLVSQRFENPYFGIIVFLVIPSLFVLGLLLMPIGLFLAARRLGGYRRGRGKICSNLGRLGGSAAKMAKESGKPGQGDNTRPKSRLLGNTQHSKQSPSWQLLAAADSNDGILYPLLSF